jgi:transcriptional regulator with XRE-family HTH domain
MTSSEFTKKSRSPTPEELKNFRESNGLYQKDFAKLIHRTLRNYQQIESGERPLEPGLWELIQIKIKLYEIFGIFDLEELMSRMSSKKIPHKDENGEQ